MIYHELDQLITEQVDYLHASIETFNSIIIDLSKCQKNDPLTKIFTSIEKTHEEFNKKIKELQDNIINYIKDYKSKLAISMAKKASYQHQNLSPILGIDLGTSNSTVGYYRLNSRKRGEMDIVANLEGSKSIPSVVCIVDQKISVGKEAIKMSHKYPKNFIYDSKRMLGKKFDDQIIQEYKKNWTFDIVPSKTGGILIKVDDKLFKPYEISGMILTELMNLGNSHLSDQTNQAIITVPAYFTEEQIEDTKRAAKYANIELIDLLKEPLAATFCYGYKTNDLQNSKKSRDILIYDFGGGTLDVSYVEVKGSEFNVLATAGDSDLGGQDFTNYIYALIEPNLDKICVPGWQKKSQFVSKVKKYCEDAKVKLSSVEEYELYFDVPKDVGKERDTIFEQVINREEFKQITKPLFDRCMNPVLEVLGHVKRDPHNIESLVLVGGSSYLPMILDKLYELTGKEAYHGVSAVDAVAFGACVIGGQYIQQKLIEMNQQVAQIDSKDAYLLNMKVNNQKGENIIDDDDIDDEFVTSTIGVVKYSKKQEYYEDVIQEGNPLPYTKDVLIYNTEVCNDPKDKTKIIIPIFIWYEDQRTIIDHITYHISSNDNFYQKSPLLKVKLTQNQNGIFYCYRRASEDVYSNKKQVKFDVKKLYSDKKENQMMEHKNEEQGNEQQQNIGCPNGRLLSKDIIKGSQSGNRALNNDQQKFGQSSNQVLRNDQQKFGQSGNQVLRNDQQNIDQSSNRALNNNQQSFGQSSYQVQNNNQQNHKPTGNRLLNLGQQNFGQTSHRVQNNNRQNPGHTDNQQNPGHTGNQQNPGNSGNQQNPGHTDNQQNPGHTDNQHNLGNSGNQQSGGYVNNNLTNNEDNSVGSPNNEFSDSTNAENGHFDDRFKKKDSLDNFNTESTTETKWHEVPRDLIVAYYNHKNKKLYKLAQFDKGSTFPCSKEASLSPLDLNVTYNVGKISIKLFIIKENQLSEKLTEIIIDVTKDDKCVHKQSPLIDMYFEFDENGDFICRYANHKIKTYYKLNIEQEKINDFIYN